MSDEIIEKQFNTNVFGLMRVTREAIKHMRPNGGGTDYSNFKYGW